MTNSALPTFVDLRSAYDRVYNQGPYNACGPMSVVNAWECISERATGTPHRFDPYYIWDWVRFHRGMSGTNTGSDFASLEKAVRLNGIKSLDSGEVMRGLELARTYVASTSYAELKHLLSMGVPVILDMKVTPGLHALAPQRDWRKHDLSADTSVISGQHYVCVVGYDDNAGRWLCENSWGGADWGDGGFFGIPYASLQPLTEALQHFNMLPINPKPVDGYAVFATMLTAEKVAFFDRAKDQLLKSLMSAYAGGDAQAMIDACVAWGVSDKHLENIAGWPRGTVRQFKNDNQELKWTGFVWDQL